MLKLLYDFNHEDTNWTIKPMAPVPRHTGNDQIHMWGGGRTRRLLQAAYTIAFLCLLRFDEVLKIKAQDITIINSSCIRLTLPFRKTDQFGGTCLISYTHLHF